MTTQSEKIKITIAGISVALAVGGCSPTGTDIPRSASTPNAGVIRSISTPTIGILRSTSTPNASITLSATASSGTFTYRDGNYRATGQYGNLPSSIGVSLTLDDDIITAVDVTPHATNPTSLDLQRRFAAAIPAVVVGRDIDEVYVDRLAGSSATPDGFNAAIQQIKEQAR
jgi:uncharacterized protein with FMN-binding domain